MTPRKSGGILALALVTLPALILPARDALAAGFAVREQSGSALGNAFAGSASGVDDVSYSFYNPAMMGFLSGNQAALSGFYIRPDANFEDGAASTDPSGVGAGGFPIPINPTPEFSGNKDIGRDAILPSFYGMASVTDELRLGLGISMPFGLLTDNREGWIGRYHALKSDLKSIEVNPTIAYRALPSLSIAGGFRALYADAELSNAVDAGTICLVTPACNAAATGAGSPPQPTQQDVRAKVKADDWGFGFNLGVMYEPTDGLRLGLSYRSSIDLDVEGNARFDHSESGLSGAILKSAGLLISSNAKASVDLPDTAALGVTYDVTDEWALMGQVEWWNWSNFDELRVEFDNAAQPDSVTEENWDDSWFFAAGTTYKPKGIEGLTLRLGVAFDESPVPERTRTPRIPDEDRYWLAAGIAYTPSPWLTLSLSYTHIFVRDADIDLKSTDEGNQFRGNLSGTYEAHIDIIGLQATARF